MPAATGVSNFAPYAANSFMPPIKPDFRPAGTYNLRGILELRFPLAKTAAIKHCRTMESHELLREVFEKKTPKQISSDLELSTSMIYKWTQPPDDRGSGVGNPLDRVAALFDSTGDHRLIQWLCQRAGGFYIPNPKNVPHPDYLIPATNQIVQEFAEATSIRARWEELKSVTEGFVECCESGNFGPLKPDEAKKTAAD